MIDKEVSDVAGTDPLGKAMHDDVNRHNRSTTGTSLLGSPSEAVTDTSFDWFTIPSEISWTRVDLEKNDKSVVVVGDIQGPIERNPRSIIVRLRFFTAGWEEIEYKPAGWSYSSAAKTYVYLAKWQVSGRFYLKVDPPPTASRILLCFQRWAPPSPAIYSARIRSIEGKPITGSHVSEGSFKGTNRATLLAQVEVLKQLVDQQNRAALRLEKYVNTKAKETETRVKNHLSYRLGKEIVISGTSPLAWVTLPRRLLRTYKDFRLTLARPPTEPPDIPADVMLGIYRNQGVEGLIQYIRQTLPSFGSLQLAKTYLDAAEAIKDESNQSAQLELVAEIAKIDQALSSLKKRFREQCREQNVYGALRTAMQLNAAAKELFLEADAYQGLGKIISHPVMALSLLQPENKQQTDSISTVPGRLCYFLHNSLPYASGGYATRAHGLSRGLTAAGWEVIAYTRPGFPVDTVADLPDDEVPVHQIIEDISYRRILSPSRKAYKALPYLEHAIEAIEDELASQRPEVVIAASNYITALPALIAARRLGIPFYYEVRGFWEITRLSREPQYKNEFAYSLSETMESAVASQADGVFTLTRAMKEELERRGVPQARISILPNCCDADKFQPRNRDLELQEHLSLPNGVPVIGYIGTFVGYEGLEDLADACGLLKKRGIEFRLLLVGNENVSGTDRGAIWQAIEERAQRHQYTEWLIMPGRVSHELVPSYYSLIDIAPFPRKPLPVTEMVSPMKPLEAMAMEKAVVVSSVRALEEIVAHEETGLVFEKGDVGALSAALERLVVSDGLRKTLSVRARHWVVGERSWVGSGRYMTDVLRGRREE